jgi:hypothetical protein
LEMPINGSRRPVRYALVPDSEVSNVPSFLLGVLEVSWCSFPGKGERRCFRLFDEREGAFGKDLSGIEVAHDVRPGDVIDMECEGP